MVTNTTIDALGDSVGSEVRLVGWMKRNRPSGKVQFLVLRDGTGVCQCVIDKGKISEDLFADIKHLGQESSLSLTGEVRREKRSVGGYELAVTDAQVIQRATDYPITPKAHGFPIREEGQDFILSLIRSIISIPFHSHTTTHRPLPLLMESLLTVHIEQGPKPTHAKRRVEVRLPECHFVLLNRSESDAAITVQDV